MAGGFGLLFVQIWQIAWLPRYKAGSERQVYNKIRKEKDGSNLCFFRGRELLLKNNP